MKGWVEVGKKKSEIRKSRLSLTEIIIRLFLCPPILIVAPFFLGQRYVASVFVLFQSKVLHALLGNFKALLDL